MPITCQSCGEKNGDDATMCGMCGAVLKRSAQTATQTAPAPKMPPPQPSRSPQTTNTGTPNVIPTPVSPPARGVPRVPVQQQHVLLDAGFWHRFCATLFEGMLAAIPLSIVYAMFIVTIIMSIFTGTHNAFAPNAATPGSGHWLLIDFITLIIAWLYNALMECSSCQGTLGKMAANLIVTDMDGNRISFGQASLRFLCKFLSFPFFIVFVVVGFTEYKQGLHDLIAKTRVVRKM